MNHEIQRQQAMTLIAMLCLTYHLTPADLEEIAHQLAHFDAVCDYRAQGVNNVANH